MCFHRTSDQMEEIKAKLISANQSIEPVSKGRKLCIILRIGLKSTKWLATRSSVKGKSTRGQGSEVSRGKGKDHTTKIRDHPCSCSL